MATHLGKDGSFYADATGGTPAAVGEIVDFAVTAEAELVDTSAKGDTWRSHSAGLKSWSGTFTGHLDEADTKQVLLREGSSLDLELYPEGTTAGFIKLSGTAIVGSVEYASPSGADTAKINVSFTGDGALTEADAT